MDPQGNASDPPLTAQSMLKLLQGKDYEAIILKCVQPLFTACSMRMAHLEHTITQQSRQIADIWTELTAQRQTVKRLTHKETNTNDQQSRLNNLVVTGLKVGDIASMKEQFIALAGSNLNTTLTDVDFEMKMISNATQSQTKAILTFSNVWKRNACLDRRLQLKDTGVFVSEDLSKETASLFYQARQLRKKGDIRSTWTKNNTVFVQVSQENEPVQVHISITSITSSITSVPYGHTLPGLSAQGHSARPFPPYGPLITQPPQAQSLLTPPAGHIFNPPASMALQSTTLPPTASEMLYAPPNPPPPMQPTALTTTTDQPQLSTQTTYTTPPASNNTSTETFLGFTKNDISLASENVEKKKKELRKQLQELENGLQESNSVMSN